MDRTVFRRRAIALSREKMQAGEGGPFGAVVVQDGRIVGEGWNRVLGTNDPRQTPSSPARRFTRQAYAGTEYSR